MTFSFFVLYLCIVFVILTKISKSVLINTLFFLLRMTAMLLFYLASIHGVPTMETQQAKHADGHWKQRRDEGHIKPQQWEQSCPGCYFRVNLMGAVPVPNSIKAEKRFFTLAAHMSHLGSSLTDSSFFVLRGGPCTAMFLGLSRCSEIKSELSSTLQVDALCWWRRVRNTCIPGILSAFSGLDYILKAKER